MNRTIHLPSAASWHTSVRVIGGEEIGSCDRVDATTQSIDIAVSTQSRVTAGWDATIFVPGGPALDEAYLAELDEAWADLDSIVEEAEADVRTGPLLIAARQSMAGRKKSLRNLRLAAGLSQKQLADKIGADQAYVSRLETGKDCNPRRDRIKQLATAMNVSNGDVMEALDG